MKILKNSINIKKQKILNVFNDMIAYMLSNKKLNPVVTESHFIIPKNIGLNSTHYFLMKIPNKRKLPQNAFNQSSDSSFNHSYIQDVINLYKKCTLKPYSFWVIGSTLASDNPLCFRKNLLERYKR